MEIDHSTDIVDKVIASVKDNFSRSFKLEDIIAYCGYSASQVRRLFVKRTGCSPMKYISLLRLQEVCHLLCNSDYKIYEISGMVGYEDPYYLSRAFKRKYGISPQGYRKRCLVSKIESK